MDATLHTSRAFAAATASGADWRDVGRKILESLESVRTEGDRMNVGFLYATQDLAPDLGSLLSLLKNVTRVPLWYGATGQGICGGGRSIADQPAAVAMVGHLPEGSFHGFSLGDRAPIPREAQAWLAGHSPGAALTHGVLCAQAAIRLHDLRERDGIFSIGGFSGGPNGGLHIADGAIVRDEPLSGLLLDSDIRIMSATSFGCARTGRIGRITRCTGNVVHTIDDRPGFDVLREAIDQLQLDDGREHRQGHVHAAFPVQGSDRTTILMRNITDASEESGDLAIAHHFSRGDAIEFVYRDHATTMQDLSHVLTGLYARACEDSGASNMQPKAVLYFGCGARLPPGDSSGAIPDEEDEAALIARVFGNIPMAGFYTAAEICNGHVYGYTGVVVLLL